MTIAFPDLRNDPISFPLVPGGLEDPKIERLGSIIRAACDVLELHRDRLLGPGRMIEYANARHLIWWIAFRATDRTLSAVGAGCGRRGYSAVWNGIGRADQRIRACPLLAARVDEIMRRAIEWDRVPLDQIALDDFREAEQRARQDEARSTDEITAEHLAARIRDLRARKYSIRSIMVFTKAPYETVAREIGIPGRRIEL